MGKTAAARLILEEAKAREESPFRQKAKFVEIDATACNLTSATLPIRCSALSMTRSIRGAGAFWQVGIPQPRPGAVCETHGGILFIDEIGELHPIQMNKLLKILEDRVAHFQSSYYSRRNRDIPPYIHEIFQKGIPADFRLVGGDHVQPGRTAGSPALPLYGDFFRPSVSRYSGADCAKQPESQGSVL